MFIFLLIIEEEDEDIVLSSPERPAPTPMSEDDEDVLEATIVEPSSSLKRSRKLVAKTFMDKDGFVGRCSPYVICSKRFSNIFLSIVTTREYETCEEKEKSETVSSPKEITKTETVKAEVLATAAKQPSPPGKTKQKSITSFFMRK